MPPPMTMFTISAARLQRPMARTRSGFRFGTKGLYHKCSRLNAGYQSDFRHTLLDKPQRVSYFRDDRAGAVEVRALGGSGDHGAEAGLACRHGRESDCGNVDACIVEAAREFERLRPF